MNRRLLACLIMAAVLLAFVGPAWATPLNWGNTDLNPVLRRVIPNDLKYSGTEPGGVSTIVSTVSKLSTANMAFGLLKLSGASKTFSMDAGVQGKQITLIKDDYDARTLKLDFSIDAVGARTACTGWSSVTWGTAPGGFVTLLWLDDTNGWIITGSGGSVTITY